MFKKITLYVFVVILVLACIAPAYAAKPAKESGAQMEPETNAAYADDYRSLEKHSHLTEIGKPVGYACNGSMSAGLMKDFPISRTAEP